MKADSQDLLAVATEEGSDFLDQIRNDRHLIERLKITPEELEALSKCSLFGTLTCKQDMLFILRQIREASGRPAAGGPLDQTPLFAQPPAPQQQEEDPVPPQWRRITVSPDSAAAPERSSVVFWMMVLVAGLALNFLIAVSFWRNGFMTTVGRFTGRAGHSAVWYSNLDRPDVLFLGEVLFVVAVAVVIYLKSRRAYRRFRVRPRRGWR
ncbi:hypothetical protein [Candidatus Binatus sp.]|uniref:hypothetical protein n=1 Tax=Candidatus Binatus sp. TaxID=2811406 RepID=UPI003F947C44